MGAVFFIALVCLDIPRSPVLEDRVDVMELNWCYNSETGRLNFVQLIFWEWKNQFEGGHYVVVDWRMADREKPPIFRKEGGMYVLIFKDRDCWRSVKSKSVRYTWTYYDPEVDNRKEFAREFRRGLVERGAER